MPDEYYEEDEAPKKRRVVRPASHDEAPEVSEKTTAPPAQRAPGAGSNGIRGGWTAGRQIIESGSQYAQYLKLTENAQIIKFLDDAPYANYARHWVQRANGKRSYVCLGSVGKECPLCSVDPRPQNVSSFNVALVAADGVLLKTWDAGTKVFNSLQGVANNSDDGTLTSGFYKVYRSGEGPTASVQISEISERALVDKYGIDVPSEADLRAVGKYDADTITVLSAKELAEVAAEISGGDHY